MLLASSISTFETSPERRMQGSLKSARNDLGVCKKFENFKVFFFQSKFLKILSSKMTWIRL